LQKACPFTSFHIIFANHLSTVPYGVLSCNFKRATGSANQWVMLYFLIVFLENRLETTNSDRSNFRHRGLKSSTAVSAPYQFEREILGERQVVFVGRNEGCALHVQEKRQRGQQPQRSPLAE
jgi:hypothetical protein